MNKDGLLNEASTKQEIESRFTTREGLWTIFAGLFTG